MMDGIECQLAPSYSYGLDRGSSLIRDDWGQHEELPAPLMGTAGDHGSVGDLLTGLMTRS